MYYYMIATIGICGFFSWLDWGDGCGEENGCEEMKCLSHHTETRVHAINKVSITVMLTLTTLWRWCLLGVSSAKLLSPHLPCCILWRK